MTQFTVGEPLILLYVTKTMDEWGILDSVQSGWKMDAKRAQQYRLMLARDDDKIVGAYRPIPDSWYEDDGDPGRWFFDVDRADDVWADYVGKFIPPGVINRSNRPVVRYLPD